MPLEDRYLRSRKGLLVASGLLLLSLFVGISQKDGFSGGILPFQLDNPGYIPHALAVLVLYSIYNTAICWSQLISEVEIPGIRSRDFFVVIFI